MTKQTLLMEYHHRNDLRRDINKKSSMITVLTLRAMNHRNDLSKERIESALMITVLTLRAMNQ
jgi:hypothetical protein